MLKQTATPPTLYAILSGKDADTIRDVIVKAKGLKKLSAVELYQQLQTQGQKASIWVPLYEYLKFVEGSCTVTYEDSCPPQYIGPIAGHTTIGVGLDLKHNDAEALFYNLSSTKDWDYPAMQKNTGLPKPPLTDGTNNSPDQVGQLLLLTLVGVPDTGHGQYVGILESLIKNLGTKLMSNLKHIN
jgi:hypothetical protein